MAKGTVNVGGTTTPANADAAGLMSAADKAKLDGIAEGANKYIHPSYTARTGVPTANASPALGDTLQVTQPVCDATGHITGMNTRTITLPKTAPTGTDYTTARVRNIKASTTDLTAGTSPLDSGAIYLVYE